MGKGFVPIWKGIDKTGVKPVSLAILIISLKKTWLTVEGWLYAKQKKGHRCTEQILDSVGEGEDGMFWENSIETSILSRMKQITSPGWMHETSAQGWCTGKTQRDGMGREVGGELGMGNTCKSMADSCQCMAKTTTIL